MKRIGLLIGFLAVLMFLVPLDAQDVKKKDSEKTDKKEVDKTVDKKDPDKKEEKKKPEKLVFGGKRQTKITGIKPDTAREFSIEVQEQDPMKVASVAKWAAQRQQALQA